MIFIFIFIIIIVVGLMLKWFLCVDEHDQETFVLFRIAKNSNEKLNFI